MSIMQRTLKYRKSEEKELLLQRINQLITPLDEMLSHATESKWPVTFIIGPPRSATTLTSQLFASAGCFGFISNFAARFYSAPALGLQMARVLGLDAERSADYKSEYGVTKELWSPHEFGYFWNRWFDQGQATNKLTPSELQRVDGEGLRRALARMEDATGLPMVFKNSTWCTYQIKFLRKLFPNSIWVVCRRHPFYAAQSIANGRKQYYGDINAWWSLRPAQFESLKRLPWSEQVAGQVRHTLDEIDEELDNVDKKDIVEVRYEDLCQQPWKPVHRVVQRLRDNGAAIEPVLPQQTFNCQNTPELPQSELHDLEQACLKWFGMSYNGWTMPMGQPSPLGQ